MALLVWFAEATPSPVPAYEGDPNLVTPGVIGFVITFLIAAATVLLLLDMTRRVRRVRYREEVREQLAAEAAEGEPITPTRPAQAAQPAQSAPPARPAPKKPRRG
jgi:hypothetical protein